jgi:hypothetical protein
MAGMQIHPSGGVDVAKALQPLLEGWIVDLQLLIEA